MKKASEVVIGELFLKLHSDLLSFLNYIDTVLHGRGLGCESLAKLLNVDLI